jgi:hydroxymethylpyrimidine/phosphomethylpyrimidine kinase
MRAPTPPTEPVILIIAGYDPSGGGGVLADLRAARACGVRAVAAVTAVTAQNTFEITRMTPVPANTLRGELDLLSREFPIGAVKLGMLGTAELAAVVADFLRALPPDLPVVLDPVLVATAGLELFEAERLPALTGLFPFCALVTPNLPELGALTGCRTDTEDGRRQGAGVLLARGARAVLVKGGHGGKDTVVDELHTSSGVVGFTHPRLAGPKVRGTGCFLAAAIACGLLRGLSLTGAVDGARARLLEALASAWFPGGHNGLMSDL